MKYFISLLLIIFLSSCIPLRVAPQIEDYKIKKGKRFKRQLSKENIFIFKDPKNVNEFNKFIEAKFGFENESLEGFIPIKINGKEYFFNYFEVERKSKKLNLIPFLIDANRAAKGKHPVLEEMHTSRNGHWYITITIANNNAKDCLKSEFIYQKEVITYLKKLKDEYLSTNNYTETLLKR